jgi:hypothetical protein
MFGIMNHLSVTLCADAEDAVAKGYDYKGKNITPVTVKEIVVIRNGTVGENATLDFLMEDQDGNRYMFMVTGNLIKSLPV